MTNPPLTVQLLNQEAASFAAQESCHSEPSLYGVTDGKAVSSYLEHKFQDHLETRYTYDRGCSAQGVDFPGILVDMKVTSAREPQSSCAFRSARQKIYGLGYSLLLFVYEKTENSTTQTSTLDIQNVVFIDSSRTADFRLSRILSLILDNGGNEDDLVAFMVDKNLPVDDIQARKFAKEILSTRPNQGYLTISNTLQWRLQYKRVIELAGQISGIDRVR